MQRILQVAVLTFLICLCISATVALGTFLYARYGDAPSKISELERRTEKLEAAVAAHKQWHVEMRTNRIFLGNSPVDTKRGDLQLSASTNGVQTFSVMLTKSHNLVAAYLNDWAPHSEIQKFAEFRVVVRNGEVFVDAIPRSKETISMEFTCAVICEDW
jgi:hypothetical protein